MAQSLHRDGGTVRRVRAGARRYHLQADRRFERAGVLKMHAGGLCGCSRAYARLKAAGIGIVEDKVIQHETIAALCPTSVNTIQVATSAKDKKEGIVYAYIRIGNGKVMDNVDCGGMAADQSGYGVISGVGANKAGEA